MTRPYWTDGQITLYLGDALEVLREQADDSVDCCVTSPPFFGLRDYGIEGQYGLEDSPDEYVAHLRPVFAEVSRVLADDGTLWLNLGDTYYSGRGSPGPNGTDPKQPARRGWVRSVDRPGQPWGTPKSLLMIPERVVMALQEDGWRLRNKGVWHKTNPTPDRTADRLPTTWEPWFLLVKSRFYWFRDMGFGDVWDIPYTPLPGAHSPPFPFEFALRCVQQGCRPGGTVLDPFSGTGTTGQVARCLSHPFTGIDLDPRCHDLALTKRELAQSSLLMDGEAS
jgi:site-specific DNA-methyltransferase (cytosine-N4-specific)